MSTLLLLRKIPDKTMHTFKYIIRLIHKSLSQQRGQQCSTMVLPEISIVLVEIINALPSIQQESVFTLQYELTIIVTNNM